MSICFMSILLETYEISVGVAIKRAPTDRHRDLSRSFAGQIGNKCLERIGGPPGYNRNYLKVTKENSGPPSTTAACVVVSVLVEIVCKSVVYDLLDCNRLRRVNDVFDLARCRRR
jgi:hypothetical protein